MQRDQHAPWSRVKKGLPFGPTRLRGSKRPLTCQLNSALDPKSLSIDPHPAQTKDPRLSVKFTPQENTVNGRQMYFKVVGSCVSFPSLSAESQLFDSRMLWREAEVDMMDVASSD